MSLGLLIFLMIFAITVVMGIYYAIECLPILLESSAAKRPYNPEHANLISADYNENSHVSPIESEPKPNAPTTSKDADESSDENSSPAKNLYPKPLDEEKVIDLDEPDHYDTALVNRVDTLSKEERREEIELSPIAGRPLLQGDDEDGLFQPNLLSKRSAFPASSPSKQPMNRPEHVAVNISQPIAVPQEQSLADKHPPSHVVVTVPPLMVAPVYDEPPIHNEPAMILNERLHMLKGKGVTPVSSVNHNAAHDNDFLKKRSYGWSDSVSTPTLTEEMRSTATQRENTPQKSEVNGKAGSKDEHGPISSSSPDLLNSKKPNNDGCMVSVASKDLQKSPISISANTDDTDSSEPEINEYAFNRGRDSPAANQSGILADELQNSPNIKILKYTQITESSTLEAAASETDSIVVHVADCNQSDACISDTEGKNDPEVHSKGNASETFEESADKTEHARRSPDGDSMKSEDDEKLGPASCSVSQTNTNTVIYKSDQEQVSVVIDIKETKSS